LNGAFIVVIGPRFLPAGFKLRDAGSRAKQGADDHWCGGCWAVQWVLGVRTMGRADVH
jgi:hypothetical protein